MFSRTRSRDNDGDRATPPPTASSSTPSSPSQTRNNLSVPPRRPVQRSRNQSSVRIRRTPSSQSITSVISNDGRPASGQGGLQSVPEGVETSGRRRSSSEPQRPSWIAQPSAGDRLARVRTGEDAGGHMSAIPEGEPAGRERSATLDTHLGPHFAGHEGTEAVDQYNSHVGPHGGELEVQQRGGMLRRMRSWIPGTGGQNSVASGSDIGSVKLRNEEEDEYDSEMVDLLDLIDPEVATLSTLTNVQNSLFVPNLGRFVNRRPTYNISRRQTAAAELAESHMKGIRDAEDEKAAEAAFEVDLQHAEERAAGVRPPLAHMSTISSTFSESRYAVLPHGESLAGWTEEEKAELNDMVRHMLHSRRAAFKRSMKGFGQYVKRPLGFFITLYAVLITLFGAAWVFFLIGWISLGSKKDYIVHIVDLTLVALFAIMGDGLAPFRAVDTYHMGFIAHYHLKSWRLRRERKLPKLRNRNDLPAKRNDNEMDLEYAAVGTREERREHRGAWEYSVLTEAEQRKLIHHQTIFSRSHTFYKPHETETHYAFSLRLLIIIVVLLDLHSCFQIALGACTWGISYKVRPFWLTTFILCCSLTCNITAGILVSTGDKKTRKKEVIEKMFRQQVTHAAMKEVRKRKLKEAEELAEREQQQKDADADAAHLAGGGVLPVHVPPPVKTRKMMEADFAQRHARVVDPEAAEQLRIAQQAEAKKTAKKNRWRNLPLLPYYVTKESRTFRAEEKRVRKAEKAAAAAQAGGGAAGEGPSKEQ